MTVPTSGRFHSCRLYSHVDSELSLFMCPFGFGIWGFLRAVLAGDISLAYFHGGIHRRFFIVTSSELLFTCFGLHSQIDYSFGSSKHDCFDKLQETHDHDISKTCSESASVLPVPASRLRHLYNRENFWPSLGNQRHSETEALSGLLIHVQAVILSLVSGNFDSIVTVYLYDTRSEDKVPAKDHFHECNRNLPLILLLSVVNISLQAWAEKWKSNGSDSLAGHSFLFGDDSTYHSGFQKLFPRLDLINSDFGLSVRRATINHCPSIRHSTDKGWSDLRFPLVRFSQQRIERECQDELWNSMTWKGTFPEFNIQEIHGQNANIQDDLEDPSYQSNSCSLSTLTIQKIDVKAPLYSKHKLQHARHTLKGNLDVIINKNQCGAGISWCLCHGFELSTPRSVIFQRS